MQQRQCLQSLPMCMRPMADDLEAGFGEIAIVIVAGIAVIVVMIIMTG